MERMLDVNKGRLAQWELCSDRWMYKEDECLKGNCGARVGVHIGEWLRGNCGATV